MTIPVIVVPGLGGSGDEHWQSHLERAIPNTIRVRQDDWDRPDLTRWLERLTDAIERHPVVVLVAHSLGCPLVAHLGLTRPDLPVAAALLVAPADVDSSRHTPEHIRGFAPIPQQPLPFRSVVVASSNDPYIEANRARKLADGWGAEFIGVGPCGHINVAAGFGRWPAGERIVENLVTWTKASGFRGKRNPLKLRDAGEAKLRPQPALRA